MEIDENKTVYMDYNATTPLEEEVLVAISQALRDAWGNPSSSYKQGKHAKSLVNAARQNVADMLGAKVSDIIFTSGGTEGNNMILQTGVRHFQVSRMTSSNCNPPGTDNNDQLPHFITSNLEHDAVKLVLEHFAEEGIASVTFIPASPKSGRVEVDDVIAAIRPSTCMISAMLANNETGVIQPVKEIFEKVQHINNTRKTVPKILLHTDAAQAIGKMKVDVCDLQADYLTVVGHKFYGPRIGAIYVRDLGISDVPLYPMFYGGGQERNYRPGTENTGMIAGLGKAAELIVNNIERYNSHMLKIRDYLETRLSEVFGDKIHINGKLPTSERLPNTCNVSIVGEGLEGYKILSECKVLQASVGAACHSQNRASPILLAIGIPDSIAKCAIRLSVGRETTVDDIDCVVKDLQQSIKRLCEQNNGEVSSVS